MLTENLNKIEEKIQNSCKKVGRNRSEVCLIAVSKTQPIDVIQNAIKAGLINLGENKAQELNAKYPQISEKVNWHFVGHLQTNKVKYVIESSDYIHSVDSIKLAAEIDKRAKSLNKKQKVLIEVNTSSEDSKFGLTTDDGILEIAQYCSEAENIELKGLMTMAPYTDDENVIRKCFRGLRETKDRINQNGYNLTELSMGMTNDFEIAIEEGSTMVRIGTAIFGERNYSKAVT